MEELKTQRIDHDGNKQVIAFCPSVYPHNEMLDNHHDIANKKDSPPVSCESICRQELYRFDLQNNFSTHAATIGDNAPTMAVQSPYTAASTKEKRPNSINSPAQTEAIIIIAKRNEIVFFIISSFIDRKSTQKVSITVYQVKKRCV